MSASRVAEEGYEGLLLVVEPRPRPALPDRVRECGSVYPSVCLERPMTAAQTRRSASLARVSGGGLRVGASALDGSGDGLDKWVAGNPSLVLVGAALLVRGGTGGLSTAGVTDTKCVVACVLARICVRTRPFERTISRIAVFTYVHSIHIAGLGDV